MSDQTNFPSNEPVVVPGISNIEQPIRTNGSALFGMLLALLPTIGFILVLAFLYILPRFATLATWGPVIEIVVLLFAVFMLAAYPLGFILGVIGLRQISKSKGREKGKGLAWTAVALSSAYLLLIWVWPFGGIIYRFVFNQGAMLQPFESPISQKLVSEGQRFDYPLFSISAPPGLGWTYMPGKNAISFQRQETQGNQITAASARLEALDKNTNYSSKEFLEYACDYPIRPPEEDRYTEQQKDCDWWRKSPFDCVRLHGLYMETGNKDNPSSSPLMLDSYTLACRHPDFYNAVIFLDYSQQSPEASLEENLAQQADVFFRGMGMNWPQGTPASGFEYETSQKIQTSKPGTNLAFRKPVKVSMQLIDFPAGMAVDGMDSNWWSAGARPPQWIEIDLGGNYVIREVQLLTSQSPDGRTIHQVLARGVATGDEYLLVHTFDGVTSNSQWLISKFPEVLHGVRYIRIETTYTPSWVGWREIEVISGE